MSTPQFIDYQAIKREVSIIQILEHYDLMNRLRQNGDNITGTCPIHESNNTVAFRASMSGNCWNCFNQCGCGGDILDFVSRKEKVSLHKAARLIIKWFNLSFDPPITEAIKPKTSFQSAACASTSHISDSPACGNQMIFAVKRYWEICDTVHVPANSIDKAIESAHALPLDFEKARYVPDSLESDPETDVHPLTQ